MVYYGKIDSTYLEAIKEPSVKRVYCIQPLDHWENAVAEIDSDIDESETFSIAVQRQSGVRRSCSFSLINESGKYSLSRDGYFWYNKKFRVLSGIVTGSNTYMFPQGVYICSDSQESNDLISLTGTDKFGNLNGELNVGKCVKEFTTDISAGDIYVAQLIRMVLLRDMGNGIPLDPIQPLIEPYFETQKLYADITLSAGQYYGEIITSLADMYGADVYYNADGRLVFRRNTAYNIPSFYQHKGYMHRFESGSGEIFRGASRAVSLDGINAVTVSTDNTEGEIYSYTAKNQNAESPLNVKAIGERYPDEPIVYISTGDTTRATAEEKCKEYAEYLLLQSTSNSVAETFYTLIYPHFDVGEVFSYDGTDYLTESLSIDLSAGQLQMQGCNIAFLPSNENIAQ